MDPLGLLLEVVALAVYPGGVFLAVMAWLTSRGAGMDRSARMDVRGLAASATADVAAAMAPLPGTPAASLPPPGGATPNLVAAVLLVAVAASLVAPHPWSRRRLLLAAFAGISVVLLGLVATSFSSTDIAAGRTAAAARILTVLAVLLALPMVVKPQRPGASAVARAAVVAATLEVVLAVVIPPAQQWPVGPMWVVGLVAAVVVYGLLLRLGRAAARREHPSLFVLAWVFSIAASVTAVIAARP